MNIKTSLVALVGAAGTGAAITALTFPLARIAGLEPATTSAVERVTGFTLATIAVLLLVHTPVLLLVARTIGRRLAWMWVAIGSAVLVFLVFMVFPIIETGSLMPVVWNIEGWIDRPAQFAADWVPFFAAAAVYGGWLWRPMQRGANGRQRAV
jgi:hypothetical protein